METTAQPVNPDININPSLLQYSLSLPDIYFNGFTLTVTPTEVVLSINIHGKPLGTINMDHITAKNLGEKLTNGIKLFETDAEIKVPSFDELSKMLVNKANERNTKENKQPD